MSETSTPTLALSSGGAAKKSTIAAWAFWDWGTQPFFTVVTTFVFAVYITGDAFAVGGDLNGPTQALSLTTTLAGLFIAVCAPVIGQRADRSGTTVRQLKYLTWGMGLLTMALYFVAPKPEYLWLGLGIFAVGSVIAEIAGVNYNSLLDRVAGESNVGKISGLGWGMGYFGGIVSLLLIYALFIAPEVGLFGVTGADGMDIRVSMVVCGIWILVFTIPIFVAIKDKPADPTIPHLGVIGSYKQLFRTIAQLWRTQRHTAYFLLASALYRDGLAAVFSFGAVVGAQSFGFSSGEILIFGAAANLIAGAVTMLFGYLDDRIGPKSVILICLGLLVVGAFTCFALHQPGYSLREGMPGFDPAISAQGKAIFWVLGLLLASVCGPAQAASRSFLARIIPEGHSGEIFGLYTTTGRVISFISPALFGIFVTLGATITGSNSTQHWGLLAIGLVLAAGFLVLLPVKSKPEIYRKGEE
ncbi:MAG: MFS transporter [Propionibacteriaceae bacterium]|jgi:UMF1 family MFS transporter|nr:MFS transporter [Propionibacteriaceae bacterium]